ncbi:MAG: RDD family protein [Halioglobus sp.]
MNDIDYAGFWIRTRAALIDAFLILVLVVPVFTVIYGFGYWTDAGERGGWDRILQYLFAATVVIMFWQSESATLGKIANHVKIVDARTGHKPSRGQFVMRYLGYYLSALPLFLGFFWVLVDPRRQAWHDKLSGTVVVKSALTGAVDASEAAFLFRANLESAHSGVGEITSR